MFNEGTQAKFHTREGSACGNCCKVTLADTLKTVSRGRARTKHEIVVIVNNNLF